MSRKLADRSTRHDRFHQKAKREGFLARAVYKLEEIDEKHDLLGGSRRVLDLGCAPGSWLQYARQRLGDGATLVGLDRTPLHRPPPGARLLTGDVMTIDVAALLGDLPAFDVVLSDMAPDTTGVRHLDQARSEALFERALEIATLVLAPGGNFIGKLFQGPDFKKLTEAVRARFAVQKTAKPASSRQISIEQYVIGKGFRGQAVAGVAPGIPPGSRPGAKP
ncbi:MAG TPA: RlmE family RNA methyltransferase [Kofleriaceae bacterium]|jgi:23S rRNA (uridine2552-2'-O)-methyltransferase|nr:RlmE family RNA methyltransferase [Kofleriaceae bacterium]